VTKQRQFSKVIAKIQILGRWTQNFWARL